MNLFDRFILTIYSFALIVISVFAIGMATHLIPEAYIRNIFEALLYYPAPINLPYLIVAIIFLLISVRFFFSAFTSRNPRKEKGIRQRNELGEVNITLNTIQTIVERTARKVKGVRDLKTTVKALESGNIIGMRVSFDGETPIPELTQRLQFDVKERVEAIAGVSITEVSVVVTDVVSGENPSVRTRRVE